MNEAAVPTRHRHVCREKSNSALWTRKGEAHGERLHESKEDLQHEAALKLSPRRRGGGPVDAGGMGAASTKAFGGDPIRGKSIWTFRTELLSRLQRG